MYDCYLDGKDGRILFYSFEKDVYDHEPTSRAPTSKFEPK